MPVTKYDRKGYKARTRQLLLTANSAIIVEEGKLKQRIDYGALKGQALKGGRRKRGRDFVVTVALAALRHLGQLSQRRPVRSARAQ